VDGGGLRVVDVHKRYETGAEPVVVLSGVSFDVGDGESLAITGPSGSGKSTLLHVIGALDPPTSGRVEVDGQDPHGMGDRELSRFRNRTMGFVFQDHHLLPQYSVLENVLVPALAFPGDHDGAEARARELVARVGLDHRSTHRPSRLSGGERQRVAVARALINRPRLLLCDEPTGSLDSKTADAVGSLLFDMHREEKTILIVVTHSHELAGRFARRIELRDGRCSEP
jgi:lipoprotein-releasing system ATP-binding protein